MSIKEIADAYGVKYELIGTVDSDFAPLVVFNKKKMPVKSLKNSVLNVSRLRVALFGG